MDTDIHTYIHTQLPNHWPIDAVGVGAIKIVYIDTDTHIHTCTFYHSRQRPNQQTLKYKNDEITVVYIDIVGYN